MIPLMMEEDYKPQGWRKSQHQALNFFAMCVFMSLT